MSLEIRALMKWLLLLITAATLVGSQPAVAGTEYALRRYLCHYKVKNPNTSCSKNLDLALEHVNYKTDTVRIVIPFFRLVPDFMGKTGELHWTNDPALEDVALVLNGNGPRHLELGAQVDLGLNINSDGRLVAHVQVISVTFESSSAKINGETKFSYSFSKPSVLLDENFTAVSSTEALRGAPGTRFAGDPLVLSFKKSVPLMKSKTDPLDLEIELTCTPNTERLTAVSNQP
jgi:hypothetical protein